MYVHDFFAVLGLSFSFFNFVPWKGKDPSAYLRTGSWEVTSWHLRDVFFGTVRVFSLSSIFFRLILKGTFRQSLGRQCGM